MPKLVNLVIETTDAGMIVFHAEVDKEKFNKTFASLLPFILGSLNKNAAPTKAETPAPAKNLTQANCANCKRIIYVDPTAETVTCPYCQITLQKSEPEATPKAENKD